MNEGYQIKQSSTQCALVFVLVDETDGYTPETGKSPTVKISKNAGTSVVPSGAITEIDSGNLPGLYAVAANATDSNTLGPLYLYATAAGCRPAYVTYEVVKFDPQDSVRLGLTALPNAAAEASGGLYTRGTGTGQINQANAGQIDTNVIRLNGTTQTARDIGSSVLLSSGTGTGQVTISSGVVSANAVQISGDSTAADNLETMLDGTGGSTLSLGFLSISNSSGAGMVIESSSNEAIIISSSATAPAVTISSTDGDAIQVSANNGEGLTISATGNSISLPNGFSGNITAAITGSLTGSVGSVTTVSAGAITSGSFAAGAITAGVIATDAIGDAELAADAVTAIAAPILAKLPAALVSGRMDASVGAYQSGLTPLQPTTAGRTLDVTTTGEAGIDWSNIGGASSTVNLSNTTVNLVNTVTTVTNMPNVGNGAYVITVTVRDGDSVAQQGALVRVTSGLSSFSVQTNASGQGQFSLDAGTYTVSITKAGYTFTPTTRTVTGNEAGTLTSTLTITAILIPSAPSVPSNCLIFGYMVDQRTGAFLAGVRLTATRVPKTAAYTNGFLVGLEKSAISDSNGLVQLEVEKNNEITPEGTEWLVQCREAGISIQQQFTTDTFDLSDILD